MNKLAAVSATLLLALPLASHAASQQKAGLWSTTIKIDLGPNTPKLDPMMIEQMKQMGVELPFLAPITRQVCLTQEQVSKNSLPDLNDPDSGCAAKNVKRSGDSVTGDLECNGELKGRGSMQMTLTGPETYTGTSSFQGTQSGQPVSLGTEFSGQWLSADCGKVKPY